MPPTNDAPAPEGWYYPTGVEDGSLPFPTVLLPKRLLKWPRQSSLHIRYGINGHKQWRADDDLSTFTGLKQDMKDFVTFFTTPYNSQRNRQANSARTMQSASKAPVVHRSSLEMHLKSSLSAL